MNLPPKDTISSHPDQECSLEKSVSLRGTGLFTGIDCTLTLRPAPEGAGILFQRTDLPGKPTLSAHVKNVVNTPRCTILGNTHFKIQMVEHLLSALKGCDLDNVRVEIDGPEIPSCDGSSLPFVEMIQKAGVSKQRVDKKTYFLETPIFYSEGETQLIALPADEFRISYTLDYPNNSLIGSQFYTTRINQAIYTKEIAPARTFSLYEEIMPFIEKGYIKGGSLSNAVVIQGNSVLNPEGIRFPNEMVRHKILDLVGDLSLTGIPFTAHVIAIRSGHLANTILAKKLTNYFNSEDC